MCKQKAKPRRDLLLNEKFMLHGELYDRFFLLFFGLKCRSQRVDKLTFSMYHSKFSLFYYYHTARGENCYALVPNTHF